MLSRLANRPLSGCFRLLFCIWLLLCVESVFANDAIEELWLSAQLNQLPQAQTLLFLRQTDGRLLIAKQDWQQWRLKLPTSAAYRHNEEDYYYLDQLQGLSYRVNESELSIVLEANISLFEALQLSGASSNPIMNIQTPWGGFLNYDIATSLEKQHINNLNIFVENGIFSKWGILNNQFLLELPRSAPSSITRLDTTFVYDDLPKMATLKIGDTNSADLGLQGSVRFFGVQLARNFGLQSKLLTFPLPSMSGEAVAPSNVDIWVNNMRALSRSVPTGAFTIDDIPIISGKGEARMVIKDILGREQEVNLPYYVSPELLKVGLQEYSYDLGVIRENYGVESQNYGRLIASASNRIGVTNYMTAELQGLLSKQQQNLSYGGLLVIPRWGEMRTLLGHSKHKIYGVGHSATLFISTQPWGININTAVTAATESFSNLGRGLNSPPLKLSTRFFVNAPLPYVSGIVSTSYSHQQSYHQEDISLVQLSYNKNLGKWAVFSGSVAKPLNVDNAKLVAQASLSISLGVFGSASVAVQSQQKSLSIQRNMSAGDDWGYSLNHVVSDGSLTNLGVSTQNEIGRYQLKASLSDQGDANMNFSMAGGMAIMDNELFLSRRVSNSFALVKVADFANVRIYKQNQLMGKTNKKGVLLVPQLLAYQKNKIRIEGGDLPFDVDIPYIEQDVVPAFRSGIGVNFAVKRSYGASLSVVLENGDMMPAGAMIENITNHETALVGFRGEAYLTNLQKNNAIKVRWLKNACQFELSFKPLDDGTVPDLGKHICKMEVQ